MKRIVTLGLAFMLVLTLGLGLVGAVSAQGPNGVVTPETNGDLLGRAWGHMRAGFGVMYKVIEDLLGLTHDEIHALRLEGNTLSEIANEQGVTDEDLIDAIVTAKTEVIDQAVADGELTEEQAEWLIERSKALAPFQLTNPFAGERAEGSFGGRMGRMPRGGMRGGFSGEDVLGGRGFGGACPCVTPEAETGTSS